MKKIIFALLTACLLLCGCSKGDNGDIDIDNYVKNLDNLEDYIILGAYKDVSIPKIEASESRIAAYKTQVQEKYSYYKKLEKAVVEKGDCVHVTFASYLNNEAFEGGSGKDDFVVGDGDFVFPELESALIGAKVGNTVRNTVTVPNDYFSAGLRGKTIRMDIMVTQIQEKEKTKPEITDAFVKEKFGLDNVAAFDEYVKEAVTQDAEDEMMEKAWKAALANCEMIKYPDGLIEKYVDEMLKHYTEQAAKYDAGPEVLIGNVEDWKVEAKEFAEDYYKSEIAMFAILDRECGRDISNSEYNKRLEGYAKDLGITVSKLKDEYSKDYLINSMYWDKVMEIIWENTKLT